MLYSTAISPQLNTRMLVIGDSSWSFGLSFKILVRLQFYSLMRYIHMFMGGQMYTIDKLYYSIETNAYITNGAIYRILVTIG